MVQTADFGNLQDPGCLSYIGFAVLGGRTSGRPVVGPGEGDGARSVLVGAEVSLDSASIISSPSLSAITNSK